MDGQAINNQDSTTPATVPNETNTLDIISEVVSKINEAHNILVALSSDPSVDEMASAIGLSLFLDKLGKRATAIYSGTTPNALEFLKPEETFESTADTLQDFVIALNKERADHLRYKLDGDFVKIFITPYKSRISEDDLSFSYGDFNVDLVLALDVANGIDLDSALREHGRIMHDAVIVNITTGNPGKFGEIEWSNKSASSVSEMIAELLYHIDGKAKIEKEEATAFLTGIVAATNRFSNAKTTPDTMKLASRLMESGANQQLVAKNITPDVENETFSMPDTPATKPNGTKLDIKHGNEEGTNEDKEISSSITERESTLLDDLKAAEASLAQAGAEATPEASTEPLKIDSDSSESISDTLSTKESLQPEAGITRQGTEKVLQPSDDLLSESPDDSSKYGKMLEEALANTNQQPNPASMNAPVVPVNPEINGVPEINYMPMPGEEVLPPPPTPPIMPDVDDTTLTPVSEPVPEPTPTLVPEPTPVLAPEPVASTSEPVISAPAPSVPSDPGAFKIPGM